MLQGCSWCDVLWKIYDCLRFGGILDPGVLCGQLLRPFISISALTHVVFSQWSFGPRGQAPSRGQPNDGSNDSFPCVHAWSGLFDGSMRYVAARDQQRHGLLMCLFCPVVVRRLAPRGSVVKAKSILIGFSLSRLNRMK